MHATSHNRDWRGQASLYKDVDLAGILLARFASSFHAIIRCAVYVFAHHSVATWCETRADSSQMPTKDLYAYYRDNAAKAYENLGISCALGPDVLWYVVGDEVGAKHIKGYFNL